MNNRKLNSIIKAYKILRQNNSDTCLIDCMNSKSLEQAIKLATTAKNFQGKKHDHQWRISEVTLECFTVSVLDKKDNLTKVRTFSDLISIIESCKIPGIGDLTIYDTAHRIGNYLRIHPDKIYLHRGTKTGAINLLGKIESKYITKNQLPKPFQNANLSCSEIEDILCIYKDRLLTCV